MQLKIVSYSQEFAAYDKTFIRDVPKEYGPLKSEMKNAIVLDVGGHIGCFSVLAVNAGAKKVIYIEPCEPNIKHAKKNLAPAVKAGIVEMIHGGVTPDKNKKEILLRYFADGSGMAGATTVANAANGPRHWRGRPYKWVPSPAFHFATILAKCKPQVLKLDCEGMEYPCLMSLDKMPDSVLGFTAEWHKTAGRGGAEGYLACTKKLKQWGFKPDREPRIEFTYDENGVSGSNQRFLRPIAWRRS